MTLLYSLFLSSLPLFFCLFFVENTIENIVVLFLMNIIFLIVIDNSVCKNIKSEIRAEILDETIAETEKLQENKEYESANWMNTALKQSWQGVKRHLTVMIENQLSEQINKDLPFFINNISLDDINLGDKPPKVIDIKTLSMNDTKKIDDEDVIMVNLEVFMKWRSSLKFTMMIEIEGLLRNQIIPASVELLLLEGNVVFEIPIYKNKLPIIDSMSMSFSKKPTVLSKIEVLKKIDDVSDNPFLKFRDNFSTNVMNIPILNEFVELCINQSLKYMTWPYKSTINLYDLQQDVNDKYFDGIS
eukprot:TRINITY_DN1457_c0_g1_i2.p1 TRINITY_DN1457_c0_g1~~TRINITY_DN1457_c0_g1_i2.p1  ORF type:complete len:301 (+),score=51.91 TRINITY_DN1457_c0_g1_i2:112-1014(+)